MPAQPARTTLLSVYILCPLLPCKDFARGVGALGVHVNGLSKRLSCRLQGGSASPGWKYRSPQRRRANSRWSSWMPYTSQYSFEKDCSVNDQPLCAEANPTVPFTGLTCMRSHRLQEHSTHQNSHKHISVEKELAGTRFWANTSPPCHSLTLVISTCMTGTKCMLWSDTEETATSQDGRRPEPCCPLSAA